MTNRWHMTWEDVDHRIQDLRNAMLEEAYIPELIVGVAKGGLVPATLLAQYFPGIRMISVQVSSYTSEGKKVPEILEPQEVLNMIPDLPSTLVVDDICDSGDTFAYLRRAGLRSVKYAAMLQRREKYQHPRTFVHFAGGPVFSGVWVDFPWERAALPKEQIAF